MKKKILFIKTNSINGSIDGIDKILLEFAKHNKNNKYYEFEFLFNRKCKASQQISKYAKIKIINFPEPYFKSILKSIKSLFLTWFFLFSQSPYAVIELSPYHYMLSFLLSRKAKRIIYYHSIKFKQNSISRNIFSSWLRERVFFPFYGRNLIIVNNKIVRHQLIKEGLSRESIKLVKNGFPILSEQERKLYISKIYKTDRIKVIGIGRLDNRKGGRDFCEFAKYINDTRFSFSYIGVNKDKDINFYKKMENYVNFHGHVEDVYKHLFNSDIGLHFSSEESGSLVLREMMIAGLPIIAWNVPTINSELKHQSEYLIEKGNFYEAKKKLIFLSENLDERKAIGKKSVKLSKIYSTKDMYDNFLKLIR